MKTILAVGALALAGLGGCASSADLRAEASGRSARTRRTSEVGCIRSESPRDGLGMNKVQRRNAAVDGSLRG